MRREEKYGVIVVIVVIVVVIVLVLKKKNLNPRQLKRRSTGPTHEQHGYYDWKAFNIEEQRNQIKILSKRGETLEDVFHFLIARAHVIIAIKNVMENGGQDGNGVTAYNEGRNMLEYSIGMHDEYKNKFNPEERWAKYDKSKYTQQTDFWVNFINEMFPGKMDSLDFLFAIEIDVNGTHFDLLHHHIQTTYDENAVHMSTTEDEENVENVAIIEE